MRANPSENVSVLDTTTPKKTGQKLPGAAGRAAASRHHGGLLQRRSLVQVVLHRHIADKQPINHAPPVASAAWPTRGEVALDCPLAATMISAIDATAAQRVRFLNTIDVYSSFGNRNKTAPLPPAACARNWQASYRHNVAIIVYCDQENVVSIPRECQAPVKRQAAQHGTVAPARDNGTAARVEDNPASSSPPKALRAPARHTSPGAAVPEIVGTDTPHDAGTRKTR